MQRILTPLLVLILALAACGDSTSDVGTGSGDTPDSTIDDTPIPVEPDGGIGDGAEPLPASANEQVIVDDDPVDGKTATPTEIVISPDDPSELWVRFVGGDPNCTAAYVTVLTETADAVEIELTVGITQDALARSCLAGEFNRRVDAPLNEPATGKAISFVEVTTEHDPPLVTPDLTTDDFVGLAEADASALADENLIVWRVTRDGEQFFAVTEDYRPDRLNFELDDGILTVATLG
jgi:hypothetical protein